MDKVLYVAMSGAGQTMLAQNVAAHNLANVTTAGFRADLSDFRSQPVFGPGHPSRVYSMEERPGIDFRPGSLQFTGNELDVAVNGDGWIAVQAADGTEAYTRAGDLSVTVSGQVKNGAGFAVLGSGGPIALPPAEKVEIGVDGTISIRQAGQPASTLTAADRIKLVNPPVDSLIKGADGLFRQRDGQAAAADANVRVSPGSVESSNVNAVDSMVRMIELSRKFDLQVKAMHTAEDDARATTELLRLNG